MLVRTLWLGGLISEAIFLSGNLMVKIKKGSSRCHCRYWQIRFTYSSSAIPNTVNPLANCSATAWLAASMY